MPADVEQKNAANATAHGQKQDIPSVAEFMRMPVSERVALAENYTGFALHDELSQAIICDKSKKVRTAYFCNTYQARGLELRLGCDDDYRNYTKYIRSFLIGGNIGAVVAIVEMLSIDPRPPKGEVSQIVGRHAQSERISSELLETIFELWLRDLPNKPNDFVRKRIIADAKRFVRNPSVTDSILSRVLEIAPEAAWDFERSPRRIKDLSREAETTSSSERLQELAGHPIAKVRAHAVRRKDCPVEALNNAMGDTAESVRLAAAGNSSTSACYLIEAFQNWMPSIPAALLRNPALPYQFAAKVLYGDLDTPPDVRSMEFISHRHEASTRDLNEALRRFVEFHEEVLASYMNPSEGTQGRYSVGLRRFATHVNADRQTVRLAVEHFRDDKGLKMLVAKACRRGRYDSYSDILGEFSVSSNRHAKDFADKHPATPEEYRVFSALGF